MAILYYKDYNNKLRRVSTVNPISKLQSNFPKCVYHKRNTTSEIIQHSDVIQILHLHKYKLSEQDHIRNKIDLLTENLSQLTNKPCVEKHISLEAITNHPKLKKSDYFKEIFTTNLGDISTIIKLNIIIDNTHEILLSKYKQHEFIYEHGLQKYIIELFGQLFRIRDFIQNNRSKIYDYFDFKLLINNNGPNIVTSSNFNNFITFAYNLDLQYTYDFISNNKMENYERQRTEMGLLLNNLKDNTINILLKGIRITNMYKTILLKFGTITLETKYPENEPVFISYLAKYNLFDQFMFKLNRLKLIST